MNNWSKITGLLTSERALLLLVFLLIGSNTGLVIQNLNLRKRIDPPALDAIAVGDRIDRITGIAADESTRAIEIDEADATEYLVYFFSPDCIFCQRLAPTLKRTMADTGRDRPVTIALATESFSQDQLADHLAEAGLDRAQVIRIAPELAHSLGLRGTPVVFTLRRARVSQVWEGLWSPEEELEVRAALGITD